MSTFASRLLDCIEKRETTQAELARNAQVSAASISDWARTITSHENVKAEPLLRAAAFLKVNPVWLLTGKGQRGTATSAALIVQEPVASYSNWPFDNLDVHLVHDLGRDDLLRLEGAWLLAAKQLGFSLGKRDAA